MTTHSHHSSGEQISFQDGTLIVPNFPIIPFIQGDGVGIDIMPVMRSVVDAAVAKSYGEDKHITWREVYAGYKATEVFGSETWLPDETITALKQYKVAIKGPLDAPHGLGLQSLSIKLRQDLELYEIRQPFVAFTGIPTATLHTDQTNITVFSHQNSDMLLKGLDSNLELIAEKRGLNVQVLSNEYQRKTIENAIKHGLKEKRKSITLIEDDYSDVCLGSRLMSLGITVAKENFSATQISNKQWFQIEDETGHNVLVKTIGMKAIIRQLIENPAEYDVLVASHANSKLLSSLLTTLVGGVGFIPVSYQNEEVAIFEASHGTAQQYAGLNKVNPSSVILAGAMMLEHIGWTEAANKVRKGVQGAINAKTLTYDFAKTVDEATLVSCSTFGDCIIEHM